MDVQVIIFIMLLINFITKNNEIKFLSRYRYLSAVIMNLWGINRAP